MEVWLQILLLGGSLDTRLGNFTSGNHSASNLNETRNIPWRVRRADNVTTFMCRFSKIPGASNSWNSKGLSSPVIGLLYLCIFYPLDSRPILYQTGPGAAKKRKIPAQAGYRNTTTDTTSSLVSIPTELYLLNT
jgi:hypothetical protein